MAIDVTKTINAIFLNANQLSVYNKSNVLGAIMCENENINDVAGVVEKINAHFPLGTKSINFPACEQVYGGFYSHTALKNISLPEAKSISNGFAGTGIENLELPNAEYIYGFADCYALKTVSLPSAKTISGYAFSSCANLEEVYIPECTLISAGAFAYCPKLSFIEGLKVSTLDGFNNCTSLKTANFPNAISVYGAFGGCYNLETVNLENAQGVYRTFTNCYKISAINLPKCLYIGSEAFYKCVNLKEVSLPICRTLDSSAFKGAGISRIELPQVSRIGYSAFQDCSNLSALILGASSVVYLSSTNAFERTPISDSSLLGYYGSIYVPSLLLPYYLSYYNWSVYSSRITSLENLQ